jgi:hypothetical protein
MKIYLSCKFSKRSMMKKIVRPVIQELGHEVVSRWVWQDDDSGRVAAGICIEDLNQSEALILFTDPIGSMNPGGGRWFEAGYAHAQNKKLIVVGSRECVFCWLPSVVQFEDLHGLVEYLR